MSLPHGRAVTSVLISGVVASGLLLAACSADPATSAVAAAPSTSAPAPEPPPTTLLSGRRGHDHQVLAVKVDNTVNAHPQAGLMAADVVYMEEVEWGLTRLMGVYSSRYPRAIGPIRSARESDLQILQQYGKVAFAYSGSNPAIVSEIAQAPLYPLSNDQGANGYSRNPDRTAPWDLFGDPKQLLNGAKKAVKARDVGFTFSDDLPNGGRKAHQVIATWPSATARFNRSSKEDRWLLTMDGAKSMSTEGPQLGGTTLIVQRVDVHDSALGDAYGGVTPTTETVGKGDAWMFRDGKVWSITWSRPKGTDGTTWEYKGKPIDFAPGQVWVLLLDKDRRPQIS
jgi:hypothetical protein